MEKLDQKEKEITRDIDRVLQLLERAKESRRYRLARRLAELYWELSYQDLVRGDILTLTLERASFYADMGLMESPEDAGLWLLRGFVQQAPVGSAVAPTNVPPYVGVEFGPNTSSRCLVWV